MTDRHSRDEERERLSREEERRREEKERRSEELQKSWRRNHPSQEEERKDRPK
jgi:hypothetical protein